MRGRIVQLMAFGCVVAFAVMGFSPAAVADSSSSDCFVDVVLFGLGSNAVCEEWPNGMPFPDPCGSLPGVSLPILDEVEAMMLVMGAAVIQGDDASITVCENTYEVPRGLALDMCTALEHSFGEVADLVDPSSPLGQQITQSGAEARAQMGCEDIDVEPPVSYFDPCQAYNIIASRLPVLKSGQVINLTWAWQVLDLDNLTGTSIPYPLELENEPGEITWINYEPISKPPLLDDCPAPWPQTELEAGMPECALPPEGWDPNDMESVIAHIEIIAYDCDIICDTSVAPCVLFDQYTSWGLETLEAINEGPGLYSYETFWSKVHLQNEAELLDYTQSTRNNGKNGILDTADDPASGNSKNSVANWRIDFVPETGSVPEATLSGLDVGALFSGFQLTGHQFQDQGNTSQSAIVVPLDLGSEITPPTIEPLDYKEKASATMACVGAALAAVGATIAAVAAMKASLGLLVPIAWGLTTAVYGWAGYVCGEAVGSIRDEGYIKCYAGYEVWHGPENSYEAEDQSMFFIRMGGESNGDGMTGPVVFEATYEQHGYHQGKKVCDSMYTDVRNATYDYYRQWVATEGSGSASRSIVLDVIPGVNPRSQISNAIQALDEDGKILFDNLSGVLFVGCNDDECPLELAVSLTSHCGTQTLTPTSGGAQYAFIAGPGCTTLTITVAGYEITVSAPLTVNVESEAAGLRRGP